MDKLRYRGYTHIIVRRRDGSIKQEFYVKNVETDVGKSRVAGLIGGVYTTPFKYIAIGTGTTAEASSDTALEAETARKEATASLTTTTVDNDTLVLSATFSSSDGLTGTSAITEYGVFDASSGGNMLARVTKDAVNVDWDAGDQLTVEWSIQVQ